MKKVMERKSGAAVRWSAWLGRYRRALDELEKCKSERYYHGTPVMVDCPRYKGPGVAVTDNQCPPDQVAVSLENGNTWWYPMEAVRPNIVIEQPDCRCLLSLVPRLNQGFGLVQMEVY